MRPNPKKQAQKIKKEEIILGYKIEREFGKKKIEDCIRELSHIHIVNQLKQ